MNIENKEWPNGPFSLPDMEQYEKQTIKDLQFASLHFYTSSIIDKTLSLFSKTAKKLLFTATKTSKKKTLSDFIKKDKILSTSSIMDKKENLSRGST